MKISDYMREELFWAAVLLASALLLLGGCASRGTIKGTIGDQPVNLVTEETTTVDTGAVAPVVSGLASLTPWGGAITTLLGVAGWAASSMARRKTEAALDDALAYGKEVEEVDPKDTERLDTIKRDHRLRQMQRGTNKLIKARL
jgi:hypothetical protein